MLFLVVITTVGTIFIAFDGHGTSLFFACMIFSFGLLCSAIEAQQMGSLEILLKRKLLQVTSGHSAYYVSFILYLFGFIFVDAVLGKEFSTIEIVIFLFLLTTFIPKVFLLMDTMFSWCIRSQRHKHMQ